MADLLYTTPPPHRTHLDPSFELSPATFAFDLSLVKRRYRKRVIEYERFARERMPGPGRRHERDTLNTALAELDVIPETEDSPCPDTVAATFADTMGDSVYNRFRKVHCEECNSSFNPRTMIRERWVVKNADGSGSTGWRLTCPGQHILYASISTLID